MDYRPLGSSGIQVSAIGLGTMTWGEQNSEAEAFAQLDLALEHGVNFIDTAELYAIPPRAETYGRTETLIGHWLRERGARERVVLATKVAGPGPGWVDHIRGGRSRFDSPNIRAALEGSLTRLGTDYVDLYQLHWPERTTNFFGRLGYEHVPEETFTPFLETLQVMDELVREGKVRAFGVSNETAWGVMGYLRESVAHGLPRVVSVQNPYNLLNRSFEVGLAEVAHREAVPLLAYSPLAFGTLSGKYLDGARPAGARLTRWPDYDRYVNPQAVAATREYVALAREHGLDPAQMALAFVTSRPFLASNLIGATTLEQLRSNLASAELHLPEEVVDAIEAIHTRHPNPSP